MILYTDSVPLTPRQRELVRIQSPDFPYSAMEGELTRYPNRCALWHWHDHFEFAVIHRGLVELDLERESVLLHAGDGFFVNANVLHQVIAAPGSDCGCTRTQLFDGVLLSGAGLIGRRYIGPIESCASLSARILRADDPDDQPVLAALNAAFAAAEGNAEGYELEVCAHLCRAWALLYRMAAPELHAGGAPRESSLRLKAMLSFIHENYARPIRVRDVAAAAGVCERECFRCFTRSLDITPTEYLTRHRVDAAARLLRESAMSAGEIAAACGFTDASYFGKVFRREFGCTPAQYRRRS